MNQHSHIKKECIIGKNKKKEAQIQKDLETEKEILEHRIDNPGVPLQEAVQPERAGVTWRFNQKLRRLLLSARASRKKKEVDQALERLEEGEYGNCNHCGKEIDPKRLEVMPATVLCYECRLDGNEIK